MAAAPQIRRVTPQVVDSPRRSTDIAANLMREFAQLESIRQNWEPYWSDIAKRIHPNADVFSRPMFGSSPAERRTEYIFESTGPLALEGFAAILQEMLFPSSKQWCKLSVPDPSLEDDKDSIAYLEAVNEIMFAARYSPKSNFAANAGECMKDLGAFGTTSLFVDDAVGSHVSYRAVPLQDLYFGVNNEGIIDRVFRKFPFSATQAVEQWGEENLSPSVLTAYKTPGQEHREFEFMHVVRPRKNPEYRNKTFKGMPLESWYLCVQDRYIVDESGYHTTPYAVSRYSLAPREIYGRSPGMLVLADLKMLNEMSRTDIRASQMLADPPILLGEQSPFAMRPGALNYDMVNADGKPMAIPFNTQARVDIAEEKMQVRRGTVSKAFLSGMQDFIREHPDMPVTNMLQIAQEHGVLLSPIMGRQQSEFLDKIIQREMDILSRAGQFNQLGPMPQRLVQAGGLVKIEYTSPLNQAQRAGEAMNIQQAIQQMTTYVQASGDPSPFRVFNGEKLGREIVEINGVPAKLLYSEDEVAQMKEAAAQQAQVQALVAAAPAAAGAAKDIAQAHATMQSVPEQAPQ